MFGRSLILVVCAVLLCGGAALAGDNNTLTLTQTSDGGSLGNSFYADQSNSSGNTIHATQNGNGNVAHIVTNGLCDVGLDKSCGATVDQNNAGLETNLPSFTVDGQQARNYVSVTTQGDSTAAVSQLGDGNSATLNIIDGSGTVNQNGNGNTASLTVEDGTIGTITQNSNNNSAALTVTGLPGAAASLTQNGGGKSYGPITVSTPTAGLPVTITQY